MFKGLYTAIITPFKNNEVDYDSFKNLLKYQRDNGVDGIVVCGTTGETPTLTNEEQINLIKLAVENKGNMKIIAGATSMSTKICIDLAKRNKDLGVDGILVATPPYNKPIQNGLYEHYKMINDNVDIPIVAYNIPSRAGIKISNETVIKLSKLKNIVALKDATGDLALIPELVRDCDKNFSLLSGNDATTVGFNAMGGRGVISVISNIFPKLCSELQRATEKNDYKKAIEIQSKLAKMNNLLFLESNPIPVKYACSLLGFGDGNLRLPLTRLSENLQEKIKNEMLVIDKNITLSLKN